MGFENRGFEAPKGGDPIKEQQEQNALRAQEREREKAAGASWGEGTAERRKAAVEKAKALAETRFPQVKEQIIATMTPREENGWIADRNITITLTAGKDYSEAYFIGAGGESDSGDLYGKASVEEVIAYVDRLAELLNADKELTGRGGEQSARSFKVKRLAEQYEEDEHGSETGGAETPLEIRW